MVGMDQLDGKIWHYTFYNDDFTMAADSFAVVSVFKTARMRQVEERTGSCTHLTTRFRPVPANGYRYCPVPHGAAGRGFSEKSGQQGKVREEAEQRDVSDQCACL